jgi:hypothetical protein
MGFKGNRGPLIIAAIFFIIVIGAIIAFSQPTPTTIIIDGDLIPEPEPSTIATVHIKSNIGIERVTITNINTGQIFKASMIDLPLKFNCTVGDYLRFSVTTQPGFEWNAWWFTPIGTFDNHNPLLISADGDICINNVITMTPKCLILENETGEP